MACSWCGGHGHNKTTCEAAPDWFKGSRPRKKSQCSYCHQTGHNVRTCSNIPEDKELLHIIEGNWRRKLRGFFDEALPGLGTGAIVVDTESQTTLMMKKAVAKPFISEYGALTWMCLYVSCQDLSMPEHHEGHYVWVPWRPRYVFRARPSNLGRFAAWQVISPASESAKEYFWSDFTNYKSDLAFKDHRFNPALMRQAMNEIDLCDYDAQIALKKTE